MNENDKRSVERINAMRELTRKELDGKKCKKCGEQAFVKMRKIFSSYCLCYQHAAEWCSVPR